MKKYRYFISYSFTTSSGSGFGNMLYDTNMKLDNFEALKSVSSDMRSTLEKELGSNITEVPVILNFQLVKGEESS